MAIRAVVFDIGGILEITPDTGLFTNWEKQLSLQPGELSKRFDRGPWEDGALREYTDEELQKSLIEHVGMTEAQADAFWSDFWVWYLGTPNDELIAYFRDLRPRYQTALLSNSFAGARAREQELYHFAELTDLIIYSHEVGVAKPERRIYELTCERLGAQPGEMIFLDDAPLNVTAAREFGIHAVLFQNNEQAIAEIQALLASA
jgi:epoxide hydrolase-like predicted phosphatase